MSTYEAEVITGGDVVDAEVLTPDVTDAEAATGVLPYVITDKDYEAIAEKTEPLVEPYVDEKVSDVEDDLADVKNDLSLLDNDLSQLETKYTALGLYIDADGDVAQHDNY